MGRKYIWIKCQSSIGMVINFELQFVTKKKIDFVKNRSRINIPVFPFSFSGYFDKYWEFFTFDQTRSTH